MGIATRDLPFTRDRVYEVVSDPRSYPHWLVGTQEILSVDDDWPAPDSAFGHRVGLLGPLTVKDSTVSEEAEPPARLVLRARARPMGRARVQITFEETASGTRVTMEEGPLGLVAPLSPVLQPLIVARNEKSLRRLERHLADAPA